MWGGLDVVLGALLLLNLALIAAVHGARVRRYLRRPRRRRFQQSLGTAFAALERGDGAALRRELERFDEHERPLAAARLSERLRLATDKERRHALETLREIGAVDVLLRSTHRRLPWRRALAARTLGRLGADEAVPVLIGRTSDRNAYVRESAVRALGRVGDRRAVLALGELFSTPGRVATGVLYDALVAIGAPAEPVFAAGLRSRHDAVRVSSCFGVAALSAPDAARERLAPLVSDGATPVRAAAAEALGLVGGGPVPEELARASRDEAVSVRRAATHALGAFDDPHGAELAANALLDPDRDTAVRAGEALVRLARLPHARVAAVATLEWSRPLWQVERALVLDGLGAV